MKNGCFFPADILLPKDNFEKWSVIACDQYTSDAEYWHRTEKIVGDMPSSLNLILPEVFLEDNASERIAEINKAMKRYLSKGVFREIKNSFIYTERIQSDGALRCGLIGMLDLRCYDYRPGSSAAIRATEETVLERIPPRVKIRENAELELPHIMLLIDDAECSVVEPIGEKCGELEKLYSFELMQNGGHISGYRLNSELTEAVDSALCTLSRQRNGFLFCVGDGNHSLAAAKAAYEQKPDRLSPYALCEVVNIHSPALRFEPIYRAVFGISPAELLKRILEAARGEYRGSDAHCFTYISAVGKGELRLKPTSKLPVGTLQRALDVVISETSAQIDYIHGENELYELCKKADTTGFIFKGMEKSELFAGVSADGSLPRKTFSMGNADDKRFYLEARKIQEA